MTKFKSIYPSFVQLICKQHEEYERLSKLLPEGIKIEDVKLCASKLPYAFLNVLEFTIENKRLPTI